MRCYRTDFNTPGDSGLTMRRFDSSAGEPGSVLQSRRNVSQDTPWSQTGPRFNALKNSDLKGQAQSTSVSNTVAFSVSGWSISGGLGSDVVFGKWGAFAEADFNPGPESFYLKTSLGQKVGATLDFLDMGAEGVKVVTYQALVRVTGKTRFSLVNSNTSSIVYDEVVLSPDGADTGWTLVTLRANVDNQDPAPPVVSHARLEIKAEGTTSTLLVWWQQAWGGRAGDSTYPLALGLANQTFVPTADNAKSRNRYAWGANALSVLAQSRLAIPAKPQRYGWEQRALINTESADLRDGEVYYDEDHKAVNMVMNDQMFCVLQPERKRNENASFTWSPGDTKNIVFTPVLSSADREVTLENDTSLVPDGTIVRIYRELTTYAVKVRFGTGGSFNTIDSGKMSEFVFTGGAWRSVVHNVTFVS